MPVFAPPALLFFCNAILVISLFTRMPTIQEGLGVDKAMLGLGILGSPLGTIIALPIAGRIADRLTPRLAAPLMLAVAACFPPLLAVLPYAGFFLCFVLFGFFRAIHDVAANMISTGIERQTGLKILARSHGFWSIGLLVGSLVSGFLAERGVSPFVHQSGAMLAVVAICMLVWRLLPADVGIVQETQRRSVFVLPDRIILLICIMIFGVCVCEGAIYDWGIFYLREVIRVDSQTAGVLFAIFTIGMGLTRMYGDKLRGMIGPTTLVRGSAICVAAGILVLLVAWEPFAAGFAFFLIGCGVALGFPLAVATTVGRGRGNVSDNLAALAMTLLIANFGVPPALGFIAEHSSLKMSFAVLLPFVALSFIMAPVARGQLPLFLRRAVRRSHGDNPAAAPNSPQDGVRE